jgi:enamine deaminase RidA (YjgF/YER057c/UK114 family)
MTITLSSGSVVADTPADGRQRIAAISAFEEQAWSTRALRVGDRPMVSGTVGVEADASVSPGADRQAARGFEQIVDHIGQHGGQSSDVIDVRMFGTDIADADAVTAAFTRAVGHARPPARLVTVAALHFSQRKYAIAADAMVGGGQ